MTIGSVFGRLALLLASAWLIKPVTADDWSQWRGPKRDGISAERGWLKTWPESGLKALWKADLGVGYGSMAVTQGRVFVLGNSSDTDTVFCFDAQSGEVKWKHSYVCPAKDPNGYPGPRCTPTVAGADVFTTSRHGHFFCLDAASGKVKWSKDFRQDFGGKVPQWGYALSALVEGDLIIVEPGGAGASVVALEKGSGRLVWKAGDDPAAYSSPMAFDYKGQRCVAVFTKNGLVGRGVKSGEELWRFPWETSWGVNAATPIIDGQKVFISSGYNRGCALIDLSTVPPQAVWTNKTMRNHVNSCVLWENHLYGFDESELKCLDWATGQVKWGEKKYSKGAVVLVDGKLLLYSNRGKLGLAEPSPAGYKELAFTQALTLKDNYGANVSPDTWAIPVLANGRLYCRSLDELVCLDLKGP